MMRSTFMRHGQAVVGYSSMGGVDIGMGISSCTQNCGYSWTPLASGQDTNHMNSCSMANMQLHAHSHFRAALALRTISYLLQ